MDFIPSTDQGFEAWALNFDTVVTAAPAPYGITAGQMAAFTLLRTAFSIALTAAIDPATRTKVTIAAKDEARRALVASSRELARVARSSPAVTDEQLAAAGLSVPDPLPSPIPVPTSQPVLSQSQVLPLEHVLRYRDSVLSSPRAKPPGVSACEVWVKIGEPAPMSIADCVFVGDKTRVPFSVKFAAGDAGKTAHYIARWKNAKGQVGPLSAVFSLTVAA